MEKEAKNKVSELDLQLEAIKELTKAVADMSKEVTALKEEWVKWRKAGKF
jgi:hypothetical protein